MKEINLSKDKLTIIDDEDFEKVNKYKWHYSLVKGHIGYAKRSIRMKKKIKTMYLHRFILDLKGKKKVDHINGNTLDNRRINLRTCNDTQNQRNRRKSKNKSSSSYKGVCWMKNLKKWRSRITYNKKNIHLGFFEDELEAAKAYNKGAKKYFKEFAKFNERNL